MSNNFGNVPEDAGKWNLKSEVSLDAEDKAMFSSAKVVSSKYGKSVCFFLKSGGQQYIPMSNQGVQLNIGDNVNLDKVIIQVLGKKGEQDILRAKIMD